MAYNPSTMADVLYRIDTSRVVSEMLDNEVIIIDLLEGYYYSLNNTGSALWVGIEQGFTLPQLLTYFSERYEAAPEMVKSSIESFIARLKELSLITEETTATAPEVESYTGSKEQFFMPALQQFQDMQEMLLADPIHDIDEKTGWPTLKQ